MNNLWLKLKETVKISLSTIGKWTKWIGIDGLLHFLVCYAMILTFVPIVGFWWSLFATIVASMCKEIFDYFIQKDNNKQAVIHDLIMDGIGIICAIIAIIAII